MKFLLCRPQRMPGLYIHTQIYTDTYTYTMYEHIGEGKEKNIYIYINKRKLCYYASMGNVEFEYGLYTRCANVQY